MPKKIGKYEVQAVLGRGGMGVVYRARDARLGRDVAIKTLTDGFSGNPEMLKRFYHEASQTSALRHPNIVIVFDAGDQDGMPYLVMEYVEGESLEAVLKAEKQIPLELRLSIVEQVCMALAYAHRNGVIHRDVKPANIIMQCDGTAKLLDFGIARADSNHLDQSVTSTGTLIGTPAYMAPERLQGAQVDGRSDIFSVGVLLYQMITNQLPFDAGFPAIIQQILRDEPCAPSQKARDCPQGLDAIVTRALAKHPSDRYPCADEMGSDLLAVIETVRSAHIAELTLHAEDLFSNRSYIAARDTLKQLLRLDTKNTEARRFLASVEREITQQEKERKVQELGRLAREAVDSRDWTRALELCDRAVEILPGSNTLVELRKSVLTGKKVHEDVSQLLMKTASARKGGDLKDAKAHAEIALQLDPHNSQIIALYHVLQQEIEEKQRKEDLRRLLDSARQFLENHGLEEAASLLDQAEALCPGDPEIIPLRDKVAFLIADEKRRDLTRRLEEKLAFTTSVEKLRIISNEMAEALKEFPVDPALLRLKLQLDPRIRQLEDEAFIREISRSARDLPPEEALALVRDALVRVPGSEYLFSLEAALSERLAQQTRNKALAQHLGLARQAIDDRLYLEAVKILKHCQREGYASPEIQSLLEHAQSAASQHISQDLIERTYAQAKQLIEQQNYEVAVQLLHGALRQVNEPVLRRQLDEATRKQLAVSQQAKEVLSRVRVLADLELAPEALDLLEEQSPGVQRLAPIRAETDRIRVLVQSDTDFWNRMGRVYRSLGEVGAIPDLKAALLPEFAFRGSASVAAAQRRLQQRAEHVANGKISSAIKSALEALGLDDNERADSLMREVHAWAEFASPSNQEDCRSVEAEIASGKKILRFRRALRR
jgi:eukaryotic-like serine/threonine-protein kinase